MTMIKRIFTTLLTLSFLATSLGQAQAAMITNDVLVAQVERQHVVSMFDRADIQAQLADLGVDPELAKSRVAAMTDAEIAQLNQQLADQPAGQDVLGLVFMVFVVLVITDMLGATDVFPFVKNINR